MASVQCSALKKGGYVMIKGRPCRIFDMSMSHTQIHLETLDIFTRNKLEDTFPSTHNMDIPNVVHREYQVVDMDDSYCSLMDDTGEVKDDVKLPEGRLGNEIRTNYDMDKDFSVTLLSACNEEIITSIRSLFIN